MRRLLILPLLAATACEELGSPGTLAAGFVPTEVYSHAGVGGSTERGQGFTVEEGGRLLQLDLWLKGATDTAALEVRILPVDVDGVPAAADDALAMALIYGGEVLQEETWHSVGFDQDVTLDAGSAYAWTTASPDEDDWNYGLLGAQVDELGEAYPGGSTCDRAVDNYDWTSCHGEGSSDYGFKVWVETWGK